MVCFLCLVNFCGVVPSLLPPTPPKFKQKGNSYITFKSCRGSLQHNIFQYLYCWRLKLQMASYRCTYYQSPTSCQNLMSVHSKRNILMENRSKVLTLFKVNIKSYFQVYLYLCKEQLQEL